MQINYDPVSNSEFLPSYRMQSPFLTHFPPDIYRRRPSGLRSTRWFVPKRDIDAFSSIMHTIRCQSVIVPNEVDVLEYGAIRFPHISPTSVVDSDLFIYLYILIVNDVVRSNGLFDQTTCRNCGLSTDCVFVGGGGGYEPSADYFTLWLRSERWLDQINKRGSIICEDGKVLRTQRQTTVIDFS